MPPQVRKFSKKHKTMCGCEVCITANSMHSSLLAWRKRIITKLQNSANNAANRRSGRQMQTRFESYRDQVMIEGEHKYPKAKQAAYAMLCPFPNTEHDLPHWKCVLGCCNNCPGLVIPTEEVHHRQDLPLISFHCYKSVTRCSVHGQCPFTEKKKKCLKRKRLRQHTHHQQSPSTPFQSHLMEKGIS